jgi:hypothetical protein
VNSFKNALLASSVLTTIGFGASATTFVEATMAPGGDFPNTAPGTNINFSMFQAVQGTLGQQPPDPADFFTFTGLTAGDDFSITFSNTNTSTSTASLNFTADGISETLGGGASKTDTGMLSSTSFTVGVTLVNGTGFGEGYTVALSELPVPAPKPSAAAIFAVGLAGLAWRAARGAANRNRRR